MFDDLTIGQLIVWLIVGAVAGNLVGRLVTLKKEGLGRWTNLGVGMGGALIGGFIFNVFDIAPELGQIKITVKDLVAAFLGALLLIVVWRAVHWYRGRNKTL
ncbi:MAG: GlsB/YeaQ/YmgE family stress response membrane protein [Pirellulales bacterium]|nr:GlsB/YeaQ/YmgE family stress response membrane protein [Pirellulales bacterium]